MDKMDKSFAWYVAGPMTGYPQFNYPAFRKAAAVLREAGFSVISPAEMDAHSVQVAALASEHGSLADLAHLKQEGESYGSFLSRDVRIVIEDVGGLAMLPGWENSTGARLEAFTGLLFKRQFVTYAPNMGYHNMNRHEPFGFYPLSPGYILGKLIASLGGVHS